MHPHDSDQAWQYYGDKDPYFAVLTQPQFRRDQLTSDALLNFFDSGDRYVAHVMQTIEEHFGEFRALRALDFGCGVGRLTLPLAARCRSVVGVDVSEPMLAEAAQNAARVGATNASFVRGDDELSQVEGSFDLLVSLIVFQHITPPRGERILKQLLAHLREGGVGALHFTYGFESGVPQARRLLARAYKHVPYLWNARNLLRGRPFTEPLMQMNEYDLNRLLCILQEAGCHDVVVRFTETGAFGKPFYGVVLFFQKRRTDTRAHA